MSVNKYVCVGRLTRDPELRSLPSGSAVCDLRIAVEGMGRGYETGYISVAAFGEGGAAAAEHLSKGWLVAVDGRLEFVEWETDAGEKRHDYTVVGNVEFLAAPQPTEDDSKPSRRRTERVAA
jgi:single-strand DNA-binding protein